MFMVDKIIEYVSTYKQVKVFISRIVCRSDQQMQLFSQAWPLTGLTEY